MKINTPPVIELANPHWVTIMKARKIKELYKFVTSDGLDYTSMFEKSELEVFLPNTTTKDFLRANKLRLGEMVFIKVIAKY